MSREDLSKVITAGTILIIETGEYSDSSWSGPVRMLKDATKCDLAEEFKKQWRSEYDWQDSPHPGDFLPWLIKSGYAEDLDNVESWHVGSYGRFEP